MAEIGIRIFRANLGARDLKARNPGWDDVMVNDYLGISLGSEEIIDQINENTLNISILRDDVEENAAGIKNNTQLITSNTSLIWKINAKLNENYLLTKKAEALAVAW
jgi:hypothetical protein